MHISPESYWLLIRSSHSAGDQHQGDIANPFEEVRPRISAYTADEIATLQYRLDKQLGPEYISNRQGPGGSRVHYLAADKVINLANEVFGFNGWSSSIQNIQVDFVDENPQTGRVSLGLSVIVRVTLRDGSYHEDLGYGNVDNAKGKAAAFEKAKKEGTTDGLKRALRNFGNVLGNCIYDKDYLSKVTRVKTQPSRFDEANLYRFNDKNRLNRVDPAAVANTGHDTQAQAQAQAPAPYVSNPAPPAAVPKAIQAAPVQPTAGNKLPSPIIDRMSDLEDFMNDIDDADLCMVEEGHPDEIALPGFSDTTNSQLPDPATALPLPGAQHAFNPKAESPSIRKTPGVDHSSSRPVARNLQHVPPPSQQQQQQPLPLPPPPQPTGLANPSLHGPQTRGPARLSDGVRRVGAPVQPPHANRGAYKPPTMKRPSGPGTPQYPQLQHQQQHQHQQTERQALSEMSTNGMPGGSGGGTAAVGPDSKRPRLA
ncbi:hypothetical protein TD95_003850 [Thielaviopsis punctulata]|uniref:RAD52 homolog n=1 Tax=Thielaviopsis punctulata TaxID=72032 RepID=A0A0F4ZHN5_9PEZI|nr:hypothetical protein TD95_003850 [Thielaviopsis punctulata]